MGDLNNDVERRELENGKLGEKARENPSFLNELYLPSEPNVCARRNEES